MRIEKSKIKYSDTELLDLLAQGDLIKVVQIQKSLQSKSKLNQKIGLIASNLLEYKNTIDSLADGSLKTQLAPVPPKDQFGKSILNLVNTVLNTAQAAQDSKDALEEEKVKLLQEDWLKSNYSNIFLKKQGIKSLEEFCHLILSELSECLNAQIGTFYIRQSLNMVNSVNAFSKEVLISLATYGIDKEKNKKRFKIGEGIVGQCAQDLKPRYIEDLPEDFIKIESGLGSSKPTCLIIVPIVYDGELYGVLEFASLRRLGEIQKKLLEQVTSSIGVNIKNISGNMLTEALLEEIAKKNNSLSSQKKALDCSAIVAETDMKGRITYFNENFLKISKYSRAELIGQDHRILNSGYHPKSFFTNLWKTISVGEVWHAEVKNKAKDGTFYWVDTTIYPVKDEKGNLQKYIAIRFDITDKKRALEDLQLATQKAEKAAAVKTEFLANMSHEIRTPMNAIIGMAELLKETPLNFDQERYVNILNHSGEALLDVINNILDLSKIESGNLELECENYDLEELIHTITDIMSRGAHKKGVELIASINPNINTLMIGDSSRLRQVLINLIGNAIKFTKQGEVEVRIDFHPQQKDSLLFSVKDSGIGISPHKIDKLFNVFTQENSSTTREYGGTGLGLAISKKIIEFMGGTINAESVEGKGSHFYFSIPIQNQNVQPLYLSHLSRLKNMRALIVDDNQVYRSRLKEILLSWEMIVEEADSAESALVLIKNQSTTSNPFQLLLTDNQLKGLSGLDLSKKLSEINVSIPIKIVMLSSSEKRKELGRAKTIGISAYMVKPIRRSDLLKIIISTLEEDVNRPTVLVVDDDADMLEMTRDILQELKIQVEIARTAQDGISLIENKNIKIVISDIKMPDMDGVQFLESVRKKGFAQPFVFISGYVSQLTSQAISKLGEADFLDKPYMDTSLLDIVDETLERLRLGEKKQIKEIPAISKKPLKILIVDDVQDNIELLKVYLSKQSHELDFAVNGQLAIDKFLSHKFDLIIMDIQMPVLDGHEAIRRIRKIETEKGLARTTIVSLSAHALTEEMQTSFKAGADSYLTKPIKKLTLLETINKYAA